MSYTIHTTHRSGLSLLVVIVILGAASLIVAVGTSLLSIGEADLGFASDQGKEAHFLADGCMDEALNQLRRASSTYTGGTLSIGSDSCILSVSGSGNTRTVSITSTVGDFSASINADVLLASSTISVTDWREDQ